jgi:hypothetical protein
MIKRIPLLIVLVLILSSVSYAQEEDFAEGYLPIDSIILNPGKYNNEFVLVKGQVTQYTPGDTRTTASYILQGEFGAAISVNTMDSKPEVFAIYSVTGTVVIDPYTQQPYIIEKGKDLEANNPSGMLLLGMFLGFLFLAILIVVLVVRYSKPRQVQVAGVAGGNDSDVEYDNDFQTIRIVTDSPKTLKFIPGKLVITAGADKGKEFMISGYPTDRGNVVSIGRESIGGDRAYSHIQLTGKTISRKQAEIIQNDGKLFLRNLSETNHTEMDGDELNPEQEMEIKPNSVIRMGEVEFQYVV